MGSIPIRSEWVVKFVLVPNILMKSRGYFPRCQSHRAGLNRMQHFKFPWGYNSVGRVSALQAECHRSESDYLHPMKISRENPML